MNYIKFIYLAALFISLGIATSGGCGSSGEGEGDDFIEDSPPAEAVNVTEPVLLTPINNESVEQNNQSIGCPVNPFSGFGYRIFFDWTDSDSPNGIKGYHLFVEHIDAEFPLIDMFVAESEYTFTSCNSFIIDSNLNDWTWSVQAEDNFGNLSPVASGDFIFELCRNEDETQCSSPPEPVPDANVSAPVLLTPVDNVMVAQNNPSIGCPFHPFRGYGYRAYFDWTDSDSPNGIRGCHLYVIQINGIFPLIDIFVEESEYTDTKCNTFVIDSNLNNWIWSVQAEDNLGILSPLVEDEFRFQPCRLSSGAVCSAPF